MYMYVHITLLIYQHTSTTMKSMRTTCDMSIVLLKKTYAIGTIITRPSHRATEESNTTAGNKHRAKFAVPHVYIQYIWEGMEGGGSDCDGIRVDKYIYIYIQHQTTLNIWIHIYIYDEITARLFVCTLTWSNNTAKSTREL